MDEPTSALSPPEVERLIELIATLRQSNRSIIYISHFLEEVMRVADRITVLRDGHKVATLDKADTNIHQLMTLILGREINAALPPIAAHQTEEHTLLEVADLTSDVFRDISFNVHEGEVVGIYGAVGAGHFDLARALFGMYRFDSGTIKVDGKRFPRSFSARYAIQHGLAYATESRRKSLLMESAELPQRDPAASVSHRQDCSASEAGNGNFAAGAERRRRAPRRSRIHHRAD